MQKRPKDERAQALTANRVPNVDAKTATPEDYGFEEFKLIAEQGRNFFDYYLRGVGLYLAVLGLILKFFFDAPPWSGQRLAFFAFGAVLNISGVVGTWLALRWYKPLVQRSGELARSLGVADIHLPPIHNVGRTMLVVLVIFALSWGALGFMWSAGLAKGS